MTSLFEEKSFLQQNLANHFDEESNFYLTLRLDKSEKPVLLPQLNLLDIESKRVHFTADQFFGKDSFEEFDQFVKELSQPDTIKIKSSILVMDQDEPAMNLAIIRTAKNKYLIRAGDQSSADELKQKIQSGEIGSKLKEKSTLSKPSYKSTEKPKANFKFRLPIHLVEQGLAKMALEFLCVAEGSDIAREPVFDSIRECCLNGFPGVLENNAYVKLFNARGIDFTERYLLHENCHTAVIRSSDGLFLFDLWAYQTHIGQVRLNLDPLEFVSELDFIIFEFNHDLKEHTIHSLKGNEISLYKHFFDHRVSE